MLAKSNIALICILGMGVGFLFSSALLSISTFLFGVNGIRDVHPRYWVRNKWWLVAAGWVLLYAITYFWSVDKAHWHTRVQLKLPFLILPLAIAYMAPFTAKQLQQITISLGLILCASACYSLSFLLRDPTHYIRGYVFDNLLPTIPDDHIRITLFMTLFIIWSVYVWPRLQGNAAKWLVGCMVSFLVLFLHIIAVKSSILSLYFFLVGWSVYYTVSKKNLAGIVILVAVPVSFILAAHFIPTFSQRADYISYSYDRLIKGDRSGDNGDVNRLMSYKIALTLIKENPIRGVGAGDMLDKMAEGYHKFYPQVKEENILLPHDQFLVVCLGCGIPAMLLFAFWVFMPLARIGKNRPGFFFFMVWLILLLQLVIEPVLEVQYGVFVYIFFLVLFKHELPGDADSKWLNAVKTE